MGRVISKDVILDGFTYRYNDGKTEHFLKKSSFKATRGTKVRGWSQPSLGVTRSFAMMAI